MLTVRLEKFGSILRSFRGKASKEAKIMVSVWVYVGVMAGCYFVLLAIAWAMYRQIYRPTIADRALLALPASAFV